MAGNRAGRTPPGRHRNGSAWCAPGLRAAYGQEGSTGRPCDSRLRGGSSARNLSSHQKSPSLQLSDNVHYVILAKGVYPPPVPTGATIRTRPTLRSPRAQGEPAAFSTCRPSSEITENTQPSQLDSGPVGAPPAMVPANFRHGHNPRLPERIQHDSERFSVLTDLDPGFPERKFPQSLPNRLSSRPGTSVFPGPA